MTGLRVVGLGCVAVVAHVGYRDLAGFGRRYVDYTATELADAVLYQLAALTGSGPVIGRQWRGPAGGGVSGCRGGVESVEGWR